MRQRECETVRGRDINTETEPEPEPEPEQVTDVNSLLSE